MSKKNGSCRIPKNHSDYSLFLSTKSGSATTVSEVFKAFFKDVWTTIMEKTTYTCIDSFAGK